MTFLNIYVNSIRLVFTILLFYYIYKKNFKLIRSVIIVFIFTFLPNVLNSFLEIKVDVLGEFLYITFIFMTVYLGASLKYYDKYFWWDILNHFLSGIIFVSFGLAFTSKLPNLNKFSTLLFCFTLSTSVHVIWEVAEYIIDSIFHTDHQRWQKFSSSNNHVSKSAIQPAGLVDTMNDIIICLISTIISCIVWYFII